MSYPPKPKAAGLSPCWLKADKAARRLSVFTIISREAQDIPAAATADAPAPLPADAGAAAETPPVQADLDNFEFYTDPEPAPPAPGRNDPSPP